MGEIAKKGWQQYMLQLQLHPLRTKAITAGVLAGVSDSVAQKLSGIQRLQLKRLLLKVFFGFAYGGPFGHFLHKLLDKIFKGKRDTKTVAKKVLFEQLTSSPWNNMLFLLYYGFVVEGRPWMQVKSKIKKEYPTVQLTSWMFWPIVGFVNHQYMPLQFRVIFHSFVACCWDNEVCNTNITQSVTHSNITLTQGGTNANFSWDPVLYCGLACVLFLGLLLLSCWFSCACCVKYWMFLTAYRHFYTRPMQQPNTPSKMFVINLYE